jgi:hypothetical protein
VARSFDVTTSNNSTVAEVMSVFQSRSYWLARLAAYGGDSMTLEDLIVGGDGTVEVISSQDMRRGALPAAIAKAVPGNFVLHRNEIWRPADGGRVRGDINVKASGVRGSVVGDAEVTPLPGGSAMRFTGTVEVPVPILGGQIEKFIATSIVKEIPGVGRFTDEWIAANV